MNSGRILTLKVFGQLKNGCAYGAQKRTECLCLVALHLFFARSLISPRLTQTGNRNGERSMRRRETVPVADACTFRGVAQLTCLWMVTEELKTC